ncbi:MAG: zinc-ribbon domain-containing protein [Anaerolineae bacterium]|nr:zinc-ribbon domain-containing protein [Anaerolineae bacterium]
MKRLLILALLLASLAANVQAQGEPTLANLEIALWPEFDRPEVLVIYRGQLDADVPLPAAIEIAVPARVGQPTAMAYVDETGQRFNQQYTTRVEGDWLIVAFELGATAFQLEYYDALPADADGKRAYTFVYSADYDTAALNLEFQEPPTAQDFGLAPPADTTIVGSDGLSYHLLQAGTVAAGDTQEWTFSYMKDNADLTAAGLMPPEASVPTAPAPAATGAGVDSTIWIFLVAFVVLIAVGGTGYWLGHRTQPAPRAAKPAPRRQKRRGSGKGERVQRPSAVSDARFCHRCGAELRSDSTFCHQCGTSVRGE